MAKLSRKLKECVEIYIGNARTKGSHDHEMPTLFDGTVDQYILFLKYYKKVAEDSGFTISCSLSGKFKLSQKK